MDHYLLLTPVLPKLLAKDFEISFEKDSFLVKTKK